MLDATDTAVVNAAITKAITDGAFLSKAEFNGSAAIIRQLKEGQDRMSASNNLDTLVTAGLLEKKADGTYGAKAVLGVAAAPLKKDAVPEWQTQIDELRTQGAAKDKALAAANDAREASDLKNAVITALTTAGAVNPNRDYLHVLPSVKKAPDGTYHTVSKDQFGVETPISLDVSFKTFLGANPELMKASSRPGSGTPAGGVVTVGGITASREQMSDPAWYAANRAAVIAGKVTVVS